MDNSFRQICLKDMGASQSNGRCLVIGEVAQTHDGSLGQAHAFIDSIANAGADAVKFQTHIAAAESTPDEPWRIKFSRQDASRYDYWRRMEFSKEQWAGLKAHADERGLLFLSSPFSFEAFDLLSEIGISVWKIASGEVNNMPLLERIIATQSPVILSSGMSDWSELDRAVEKIRVSGNPFAVLQCTSAYPCPPEQTGLNMLAELKGRFKCPTGLSDHSGNIFAGLAAVTLGAEVLEVHVTMSREMFGPDVVSSITSSELKQLVEGVRAIELMTANPVKKDVAAVELEPLRKVFNKSVYTSSELPKGTVLDAYHLRLKKPGTGIPAERFAELIGKRLNRDVQIDEMLSFEDFDR
ncbi:MAG: N-acetylneuraminate synthase family protein [Blastocatellia bacterium]